MGCEIFMKWTWSVYLGVLMEYSIHVYKGVICLIFNSVSHQLIERILTCGSFGSFPPTWVLKTGRDVPTTSFSYLVYFVFGSGWMGFHKDERGGRMKKLEFILSFFTTLSRQLYPSYKISPIIKIYFKPLYKMNF